MTSLIKEDLANIANSTIGRHRAILRNSGDAALSPGETASSAKYITSGDSDEDLLGESSNDDIAETSEEETETRHACTSCTEEYPLSNIFQTECAHNYCREFILRLSENSPTNESLYPPRCCRQPIRAPTAVEDMIGIEMTKRSKERKTETSASERTYRSNKTCARYIPPHNIRRGVGICQFCTARTCAGCKKQGHRGDCNYEDTNKQRIARDDAKANNERANDVLLEELAKKKKWQRCPNCSRMI
ncbi:hypothetical protein N7537_001886 [Penicillium hordei]|uniref:Uncharacterized protein n=1 Tax=Penicillium hordei TaxID=40994 RepID=A0AAD6H8G4_9EURO|nr:uncharacterized protein N7537_001886 [Penicillium hordei]KAJ5616772.1 hypothetical protein N7537_001886 [Penicillium hordei]